MCFASRFCSCVLQICFAVVWCNWVLQLFGPCDFSFQWVGGFVTDTDPPRRPQLLRRKKRHSPRGGPPLRTTRAVRCSAREAQADLAAARQMAKAASLEGWDARPQSRAGRILDNCFNHRERCCCSCCARTPLVWDVTIALRPGVEPTCGAAWIILP